MSPVVPRAVPLPSPSSVFPAMSLIYTPESVNVYVLVFSSGPPKEYIKLLKKGSYLIELPPTAGESVTLVEVSVVPSTSSVNSTATELLLRAMFVVAVAPSIKYVFTFGAPVSDVPAVEKYVS